MFDINTKSTNTLRVWTQNWNTQWRLFIYYTYTYTLLNNFLTLSLWTQAKNMRRRIMRIRTKKTVLVKTRIISSRSHVVKMAQPLPTIEALLDDDDDMDTLFKTAFDSITECGKFLDRMRLGAGIRTSTPAAEIKARGLVPQGEGSCEVRVPWGLDSPGLPLYFIHKLYTHHHILLYCTHIVIALPTMSL